MNSLLDTLPPQTIQTLLAWCETDSYAAASQRAAKPPSEGGLNLAISASTLCRLYSRHGIAESAQARAEYTQTLQLPPGASLLEASQKQLELRLFELACRPNPGLAELRLLHQIASRLRALQLSERRVLLAEKREARAATPPTPAVPIRKTIPVDHIKHRVRVLLGKEAPNEIDEQIESEERERKAQERRHR